MMMGSLYRPKLKGGGCSRIWWAKYYANGRPIRESTGAEKETEARRFLREREGRVATGAPILPRADRIRYEEVAEDLRVYYRTTGKRDLAEAEFRLKHLDSFFERTRAVSITPDRITRYVDARQQAGAANGTINRELATLSRMLRWAHRNGKLLWLPVIEKLTEADPRSGFFEDDQYVAVRRHLPPDLEVAAALAHAYGWRTQSEILTRERRHLDLEAGTLRIDPGETKNGDGRVISSPVWTPSNASSAASSPSSSPILPADGPGSGAVTTTSAGGRPVRKPACPDATVTTSAGPRSGTWSTRASPSAWP
jgi:hypothetical protein